MTNYLSKLFFYISVFLKLYTKPKNIQLTQFPTPIHSTNRKKDLLACKRIFLSAVSSNEITGHIKSI